MAANSPLEMESQVRQLTDIDAQLSAIDVLLRAGFNKATKPDETNKQRNARLVKRVKQLRASGVHNPTKQAADEFGISDSLVRRILRNSKPEKKLKPGSIATLAKRK